VPEENLLLDIYGAREITEAQTPTIQLGATLIRLISDPPPTSPFLNRIPGAIPHLILAWDRHQICWLAYPVAWLINYRIN